MDSEQRLEGAVCRQAHGHGVERERAQQVAAHALLHLDEGAGGFAERLKTQLEGSGRYTVTLFQARSDRNDVLRDSLTDAIRSMIRQGLPVYAVPLAADELRLDVGNFESYAQAFMHVMLGHPEYGPRLRVFAEGLLKQLSEKESGAESANQESQD